MTDIAREFVGLPSPAIGRAGAGGHPCQGIYHRSAGARPATAVAGMRPLAAIEDLPPGDLHAQAAWLAAQLPGGT